MELTEKKKKKSEIWDRCKYSIVHMLLPQKVPFVVELSPYTPYLFAIITPHWRTKRK